MSLEYLVGYSNHENTADVWILRDEGKNYCFYDADFHKLLTHQDGECGII